MKNKSQLIRWKLCNSLLLLIWLCPTWTNSLHAGNLPLALDDNISSGRFTLSLSGKGWYMWRDKQATWKNDRLYLPHEAINLTQLPANAPTGGWGTLTPAIAMPVQVPGTVEEYTTTSDNPHPDDGTGVSWWFRTINLPTHLQGKRVVLHFESVRQRAEVYLDGHLVGYDVIGESPFDVDITPAVQWGEKQQLAIRVTHPGGNFHWQDFNEMRWGAYKMIPGRSFGGIIGRVTLNALNPIHISDIYMQNQPNPQQVKAILTVRNDEKSTHHDKYNLEVVLHEKGNESQVIGTQTITLKQLKFGDNQIELTLDCPHAKLWQLESPHLYLCKAILQSSKRITLDTTTQQFGFRWFQPTGIGEDAKLVLNGRRIMLRTAISWGYWPVTGLYATPEMADRQIRTAKRLGLNMLNFHRSIGSPIVLDKADELGLLYYEEPGGFHAAGRDSFARAQANIKLTRMIKRDRSHPSLIIYNLINEWGGPKSRDKWLTTKRMNDMRQAHRIDPSRVMTFTSGWAGQEHTEEDAKAHMLPFDTTLYRKGWYDNHRAGGPATWEEGYYRSTKNNLMFTTNRTEVYMRGEEGAISTPPRLALIEKQIGLDGVTGWDGLLWKKQYIAFKKFFEQKGLQASFATIDEWTQSMGDVQLDHQGRRLQGMRMQNIGDIYAVNGWESMPYDNHSGIVDIYRNCKGHEEVFTYYTQPCYVTVSPCSQFLKLPHSVKVDFHLINENILKGNYQLVVTTISPQGKETQQLRKAVTVKGSDCYGQLLHEQLTINISQGEGMHRIKACLINETGKKCAEGEDSVLAIEDNKQLISGRGALYSSSAPNDATAIYYQNQTDQPLPAFNPSMPALDWLVVTRPSLDAPHPIPEEAFCNNGQPAFKVLWFKDNDIGALAGVSSDTKIDHTFVEGEQPHKLIPANQSFSAIWKGKLKVPLTGTFLLGVSSNQGMRLSVNGKRIIDEWRNNKQQTITRPFQLEAGQEIEISVEYSQNAPSGSVQLVWSLPNSASISPQHLLDRVKKDGTTLILLKSAESWMDAIAQATGCVYKGFYSVGRNWIGGIHFVKEHPLFNGLPTNTAMGWPYQALVHEGDKRLGFYLEGDEMIVGSYRTTPFCLGSTLGIIPYGKGRIIYSTLDVVDNLLSQEPAAEVARKLFCNMLSISNW